MKTHYLNDKTFVVENYNLQKPFANFLPGVAGKKGIPLWAFYVNRGQGISGFGLQDKSRPIMTFTPANKAYESVSTIGFRTFIKTKNQFYEPFNPDSGCPHRMEINRSGFDIEETNDALGLKTRVHYFGLPNMPVAGLVRKIEITNTTKEPMDLEVLDGIAEILPAGIHNDGFKSTSNLLSSWMDVAHLDEKLAFFKLRASTNDSSEVNHVVDGNFYLGFTKQGLIRPLVDQSLVFGYNTAKTKPVRFMEQRLSDITDSPQVTANKIPCCFIPVKQMLKPGETLRLYALSGHTHDIGTLRKQLDHLVDENLINQKQMEAETVIETLLKDVETESGIPLFDEYVKQNYLDNFLRGGYPEKIGNSIYHLYSRRHGDLERDYNFFSLAPEYYSQGNGNFRDVCQNRRLDSFIHPEVMTFNIKHFASLIQLDGYNPLAIDGIVYTLPDAKTRQALCEKHFADDGTVEKLLKGTFTPGRIVNTVEYHAIPIKTDEQTYLDDIISRSKRTYNAQFGEGYWSDHFTYILDLVESYEAIYPDTMQTVLFEDADYAYFESPVSVLAQKDKAVITKDGEIRQYGSLRHYDETKLKKLNVKPYKPNWTKISGEIYTSNLYTKLLSLVLNKHSLLDPDGLGVEMEANKPGWNDAMNGVPGLFGSGISETIETLRIVEFLKKYTGMHGHLSVPRELAAFFEGLAPLPDYKGRVELRDTYRESIRFGLTGPLSRVTLEGVSGYLDDLEDMIKNNLKTLFDQSETILPTFLTYKVETFEKRMKNGEPLIGNYNLPLVIPTRFKRRALPKFLEAPARLLKTGFDQKALRRMHENILKSDIYDKTLDMYKTSEHLEKESHEIGRIRAFTPGWLERESNFLHMTYKYLLGLLKAGLYDEYYKAIQSNLVCFMDPAVYGRNPLENSSFIAPSNNPNPEIHGQGFFARLSGSTVELLNMWTVMMTGGQPFKVSNGELTLALEPKLSSDFFKKDGTVSFTFLKNTKVTYVNKARKATYDDTAIRSIELIDGTETIVIEGGEIKGEMAVAVRNGSFKAIKIFME